MTTRKTPLFRKGDYVVATTESFGWGQVKPGMVGVVIGSSSHPPEGLTGNFYLVKFAAQDHWSCMERDLQIANPVDIARNKGALMRPSANMTTMPQTITSTFSKTPITPLTIKDLDKAFKQMAQISQYQPVGIGSLAPTGKPAKPRIRMPSNLKGLKIGSDVRVTNSNGYFQIGQVVKVDQIDHDSKEMRAFLPTHGDYYWINYRDATTDLEAEVDDGKVKFESVILADHKKKKIMATIKQLENHNLIFKEWGFDSVLEKGKAISMLFYGPPGTGKTLAAQAIADHLGKQLKVIGSAEIESSEPGQAERNIKAFFENCDKNTVMLFDECDSLVYSREHIGSILAAQVNQLLSSLESFEGIVIFTTNRLGVLDEAFNRRLSLKLEFGMPSLKERVKIWQRMFPKKAPLSDDVSFEKLAEVELSGGYIKNAVLRAARMAAAEELKDKDKKITMQHLVEALTDEVTGYLEFEEARSHNHTPRLAGGNAGISRSSTIERHTGTSTGTGASQ